MIKFKASLPKGRQLFGFLLTEENIKRLKADQAVAINLAEVGGDPNIEILIAYAETEKKATTMVQEFIGPDTVIHKDPAEKEKRH